MVHAVNPTGPWASPTASEVTTNSVHGGKKAYPAQMAENWRIKLGSNTEHVVGILLVEVVRGVSRRPRVDSTVGDDSSNGDTNTVVETLFHST
jgi:hypothetical protein